MGCSESLVKHQPEKTNHQQREFATIQPVELDQDSFSVLEQAQKNLKTPKKTLVALDDASMILKENQQQGLQDNEEVSKIKVKKARHYKIRLEHQKFIENILQSNRAKAVTEFHPPSSQPITTPAKKPALSLHSKPVQQLQINKQNAQIQKEGQKKVCRNTSIQAKYTRKQMQKAFNNMANGKMRQDELGQIGERIDLQQLDSNATLQL